MRKDLLQLGLTQREADAYMALLDFEEATATQLSKRTTEHRTNVYDSLNSLIKRSLITYAIRDNVRYYRVVDPNTLIDQCKEKERIAKALVPKLKQKIQRKRDEPSVEVFEGREGFKSILARILREEKTIFGIGASAKWEEEFPIPLSQYMKEREKRNIKAKLLYVQGTKPIEHSLNQVKFLPTQFAQPSTIAIFGDYVAVFMWTTPLTATLTKSKQLSNSFRKYFEVIWKM